MNTYPADEQRISDVERGRSWKATLPLTPGTILTVGDTILFALAQTPVGGEPTFVKGGDSVLVTLTEVVDREETDPATGQSLVQITWKPLGQPVLVDAPKRVVKPQRSQRGI